MTTQRLRSKPPAGASDNVTAVNKPVVFGTSESRPDLQCHVLFCVLISYWGIKFFESLTAWLICRFRLVWCYTPWIFWYSPMLFELHVTLQRERDRKKKHWICQEWNTNDMWIWKAEWNRGCLANTIKWFSLLWKVSETIRSIWRSNEMKYASIHYNIHKSMCLFVCANNWYWLIKAVFRVID